MRSDEHNRIEYQKLKMIWGAYGIHHEEFQPDVKGGFAKVDGNSDTFRIAMSLAAAIALLVLATFSIYQIQSNNPETTYTATVDGQEFLLPDSSSVTLRKGARVVLAKDFNSSDRNVDLIGEGYFKVYHDAERPFQVRSNDLTVRVLGTEFLVTTQQSATEVMLFKGKVEVVTPKSSMTLEPNESVKFDGDLTKNHDIQKGVLSWVKPDLVFENQELKEIFKVLEWHFDVEISTSESISSNRLTGHFNNQSIEEILQAIAQVHGLTLNKGSKTKYYTLLK